MTIFKDSHHFSRTLGNVWWQSLKTVLKRQSLMTTLFLKEPFAAAFGKKIWQTSPWTTQISKQRPQPDTSWKSLKQIKHENACKTKALVQSLDWSNLTKKGQLWHPRKKGSFSCGKPGQEPDTQTIQFSCSSFVLCILFLSLCCLCLVLHCLQEPCLILVQPIGFRVQLLSRSDTVSSAR